MLAMSSRRCIIHLAWMTYLSRLFLHSSSCFSRTLMMSWQVRRALPESSSSSNLAHRLMRASSAVAEPCRTTARRLSLSPSLPPRFFFFAFMSIAWR